METVTLHTRMQFILPPTEGIRNSNGKGVQEEAISKGWGQILKVFFSGEFETRIIVFIDVWYSLHVSNMNVIGSLIILVILLIVLHFTI